MSSKENRYLEINKALWNGKTKIHFDSEFYNNKSFLKTKNSLNEIELSLLGDVRGKKILHLQCHFGQDTISLQNMGAKVTGIDLSDEAIKMAKVLSEQTENFPDFICSDVYDLPNNLNEVFDIVFTSYGTIGWLPDLDRWAKVITHFLKPGGNFILAEFHPVVWIFDNKFEKIEYNYFKEKAIIEKEQGTYAQKNAEIEMESVTWNHSLSEVFSSLLNNGLRIESFSEFNFSPYDCFENTIETNPKQFKIKNLVDKIPMVYSLKAKKDGI